MEFRREGVEEGEGPGDEGLAEVVEVGMEVSYICLILRGSLCMWLKLKVYDHNCPHLNLSTNLSMSKWQLRPSSPAIFIVISTLSVSLISLNFQFLNN